MKEAGQGFRRQACSLITNILSDEVMPMAMSPPKTMSLLCLTFYKVPPLPNSQHGPYPNYCRDISHIHGQEELILSICQLITTLSIDSMQLSQDGSK